MLLKCPECDLQVSDKATLCPHCGCPLKVGVSRVRESAKRHRLPNGFGQIVKIKRGNLRNPYRASITVGKNPKNGRPIVKLLKPKAYFKTYNEAYEALVDYWKSPYDLEADITVSDLYERWVEERLKNASDAYIRTTKSAWSYCSSLHTMRVKDLKPRHIKGCIEHASRIEENGKKKKRRED